MIVAVLAMWIEGHTKTIIMVNSEFAFYMFSTKICANWTRKKFLENPGIDPGTSHMLSERSTIWANPPTYEIGRKKSYSSMSMFAVWYVALTKTRYLFMKYISIAQTLSNLFDQTEWIFWPVKKCPIIVFLGDKLAIWSICTALCVLAGKSISCLRIGFK